MLTSGTSSLGQATHVPNPHMCVPRILTIQWFVCFFFDGGVPLRRAAIPSSVGVALEYRVEWKELQTGLQ